ncbi:Acidic mammalian chitinase-like 5 [Homarus americanus]|uniref:Acidic mammalian chitinase-like 5 n=1 Tax=Homarus americanus TaxID=6706 RepID=A0A8J5JRT6_HOMAM|nr:Acidic mammalian chitinase-like 5 [Homarus americanus]
MMLTAAVPSSSQKIDAGYDVPGIAQSVDLVNLMTYSLHGSWNDYVHHQSGLYPYYKDTGRNRELNIANYAKEHKLAGMMVWTVDYDDFHGYCHDRSFDLIKTMAETFGASTTCNL